MSDLQHHGDDIQNGLEWKKLITRAQIPHVLHLSQVVLPEMCMRIIIWPDPTMV